MYGWKDGWVGGGKEKLLLLLLTPYSNQKLGFFVEANEQPNEIVLKLLRLVQYVS